MTDRPKLLFMNGALVEYEQARVHVLSPVCKYGAAVFEALRGYWNETQQELYIFRLDAHLRRLLGSMKISRIVANMSSIEVRDAILAVLRANGIRRDTHIRVQVFVDADNGPLDCKAPVSVAIAATPYSHYFMREELNVGVSSWSRISDRSMPPRVKSAANYFSSRLALLQAREDGYDDAIILTGEGKVSEGPGQGLFMVRDACLITPLLTDGILESITRDTLMKVAVTTLGISVQERAIDRTELYLADELFYCGTSAEIAPIVSVDRHSVGSGKLGEITKRLKEVYFQLVRGQIADENGWLTPVFQGAGETGRLAVVGTT